jgi:hypothetical protein
MLNYLDCSDLMFFLRKMNQFKFIFTLFFLLSIAGGYGQPVYFHKAVIQTGEKATPVEKRIAGLLESRFRELPGVSARVVSYPAWYSRK